MDINNLEEEKKKNRNGIENQVQKKSKREQSQFRLVLGKDAIEALEQMVSVVNTGFTAGQVSKVDLATYLFKSAHRFLKKAEVLKIRNEFFDERIALKNLIRDSETSGKLPDDLVKMLKDQHKSSEEIVKIDS